VEKPSEHASAFRALHGLGDAPIRDMFQVVEDLNGAFVLSREFPPSQAAFTVHDEDSGITIIAVGTTDNYERQRFSVAHELGHLESGQLSADIHSLSAVKRGPAEKWADDFARHVLLPISAVDKYLSHTRRARLSLAIESVSDLVRVFGVSPPVAMIQLRDALWISQQNYDSWTQLTTPVTSRSLAMRFGWASERDGLVRASETPRRPARIVKAATTAYQQGDISLEALAQVWGTRDVEKFKSMLEESGIRPLLETTDSRSNREPEDLSDLYRASP
jgi:Zn-dependent peptidase ImmA (M78 family)